MSVVGFTTGFLEEFYSGAGVSAMSDTYPASLGGLAYELDRLNYEFSHSSVPLMRPAQDDKTNAGRQTLNPEAFWRRSFESWHVGAGQTHFDREDESNPWRFRRSRGINVWDRFQVSLLQDTDAKRASANTNLFLAVAGSFLYLTDGTALVRTADITVGTPTFTAITGGTAATFSSIASDGFNVLLACGASGIDKTTRSITTKTNHITGTVTNVAYGKGRWIASNANSLYDITTLVAGGGALPAALFTHANTDFAWNSFAEGPTAFYAGGFSGDKSLIYRLTMKEDGTGLNQPVVAGFLPDGELIQSMQGYLGFVLIGTSKGVRVGVVGGNGDLTIGAFIPTDQSVLCFEGQERFVWFGWTGFEGVTTGLGRLDMETFSDTDALAPAFASDLMVTDSITSAVQSVATFQNLRVFTASASGVWAEDSTKLAATGEIDSGVFDYGLTDEKLSLYVDMTHISHDGGSHSVFLSLNRGSFGLLATMFDEHFPIATGEARANEFEIRLTFARSGSDPMMGPTIRSWSLRAQPATPITQGFVVPFLIAPVIHRQDGFAEPTDSVAQADNIVNLCQSKEVVLYRLGSRAWSVIVTDFQMDVKQVYSAHEEDMGLNGTCLTYMKTVT